MRTIVYPPPGILGFGRSRTVSVVERPLSPIDGYHVVGALADHGIRLRVVAVGQVVHLHALAPTSTADEVIALRAFAEITDSRLAWHRAVADA